MQEVGRQHTDAHITQKQTNTQKKVTHQNSHSIVTQTLVLGSFSNNKLKLVDFTK